MLERHAVEDLLAEALKILARKIEKDYETSLKNLQSTFEQLAPAIKHIEEYNLQLRDDEIKKLKEQIETAQEVLRKSSNIRWWNYYLLAPYYRTKLDEANESLLRPISVYLQQHLARDIVRICDEISNSNTTATASSLEIPEFTVGLLDGPLNNLTFDVNLNGNLFSPALYTSSSSRSLYDVFISFRGDDVRTGFKSHLQKALRDKKIETFVDDRIDKGDELWPTLVKAIRDSVLFLVIFSQNYASSTWCLRELSEILEYTKYKKRRVLAVFYNIDPSEVRYQTGSYQRAFMKHENDHRLEMEEVTKWRHNLTFAANLAGWDSSFYRDEAGLTQEIVARVAKNLDSMFRSVYSDGLFGIGNQIAHIESLLRSDTEDVQFIGIWGMVGIGKTTVATQLFNTLCLEFESTCFLDNLRESSVKNGISFLKNKLFSTLLDEENLHSIILSERVIRRLGRKKALIVLDDVNDPQLLTSLVGVPNRFGKGSRVIITARDKQVFGKIVKDNHTFEVKELGSEDALQLFKFYALDSNCCDQEFEKLSQEVVYYAKGIPSTLIALGSFLYGKSTDEWKRRLQKIIKIPCTEIQQILKLSYDGMDDEKKNILLDIASTLKDRRDEHIKKLLDAFGYSEIEGVAKILVGPSSGQQKIDSIDQDTENTDVPFNKVKSE